MHWTYLYQMLCRLNDKFWRSFVLYLTSICKTTFLLYESSNRDTCGRMFADAMSKKLTFNNIRTIGRVSIQYFINQFFVVQFCLSSRLFACGWYVFLATIQFGRNTIDERSTIIIYLNAMPAYKNCETVIAYFSWTGFASDLLLK